MSPDEMVAKARFLLRHGGVNDPERVIDGVLGLAQGGEPPDFTPLFSGE